MRVIISGGGTAGHVYPGLALAKALQKTNENIEILYVGTEKGLESSIVPQEGLPFMPIESRGMPRKLSVKIFGTVSSVGKGAYEARGILKRFKPDIVVGMGAYVSLPIVGTAALKRIPTLIHEQNAVPGLVNRMLARVAGVVAASFPGMENSFPAAKRVEFTGNPIREDILQVDRQKAAQRFDIDADRKVLLVFGGSRGAQKINEAMVEAYDRMRDNNGLQIIHATGKINYDHIRGAVERIRSSEDSLKYTAYPYIEHIGEAYAVSDLLVCRSGATTIAEITALGLPAVLVPYPHATDNHQEKNARKLETIGAGYVVLDKDVDGERISETVGRLIDNETALRSAKEASIGLGRPQAADVLASLVLECAAKKSQ